VCTSVLLNPPTPANNVAEVRFGWICQVPDLPEQRLKSSATMADTSRKGHKFSDEDVICLANG